MIFKVNISQILGICAIFLFASPYHTQLVDSQSFEGSLYSELVKATPKENIIYSPFSIKSCLAMTLMGAVGQTAREMSKTLALSNLSRTKLADYYHDALKPYQNSSILSMANKIYIMKGYKIYESFYNVLTQQFFAEIASVNFGHNYASARAINKWVENKTNNRIKDLVSPDQLDGESRLVLVNAIHLKGEWASKFDVNNTKDELFYLNDTYSFNVKMMWQSGNFKIAYMSDLRAVAVEMPYKDSNLSMLIILPYPSTSLADVETKFKTIPLTNITNRFEGKEKVDVYLPRFKYESKVDLTQPLKNMGIKRMFASNAEFKNMLAPARGLQVNSIVHKAVIEVNEDGVEAAAATEAEFTDRTGPPTIRINRPFYFAITDQKYMKIFEGRINSEFSA